MSAKEILRELAPQMVADGTRRPGRTIWHWYPDEIDEKHKSSIKLQMHHISHATLHLGLIFRVFILVI